MKTALLSCLLFSCFAVCLPGCQAQVAIYGDVGVTDYGYSFNNNSLTVDPARLGFALGSFYNFPIQSRLTAGIDLHGSVTPGSIGGDKVFVSARFGFVPRVIRFEPYLQVGGGLIQAKVPASTNLVGAQTVTRGGLDLALGLDFRLLPSLDYRILEVESGAAVSGAKSAASASISTGLVYHFHPRTS